jgi:hypothetical protein
MLNLISSPGRAGLCLVNTKGKAFIRNKTNKGRICQLILINANRMKRLKNELGTNSVLNNYYHFKQ